MSFMVYKCVLVIRFPLKMVKSVHFCILLDTPMPRHRSALLGVELHLGGGPYA